MRIATHQLRIWRSRNTTITTVPQARRIPCRREIRIVLARSHECSGTVLQIARKISVPTELTVRNRLTKNAGTACAGALSGLTRKMITRRDVKERRAETEIPNSNEVIAC